MVTKGKIQATVLWWAPPSVPQRSLCYVAFFQPAEAEWAKVSQSEPRLIIQSWTLRSWAEQPVIGLEMKRAHGLVRKPNKECAVTGGYYTMSEATAQHPDQGWSSCHSLDSGGSKGDVSWGWEPDEVKQTEQEPQQIAAAHPTRDPRDGGICTFQKMPDNAHSETSCLDVENRSQKWDITSSPAPTGWKLSPVLRQAEERRVVLMGYLQDRDELKLRNRSIFAINMFCKPSWLSIGQGLLKMIRFLQKNKVLIMHLCACLTCAIIMWSI